MFGLVQLVIYTKARQFDFKGSDADLSRANIARDWRRLNDTSDEGSSVYSVAEEQSDIRCGFFFEPHK